MKRLTIIMLILGISAHAHALTKGFSANSFIPVVDRSPYFTLYSSDTLKYGEFIEGSSVTYAYRPLQLTQGGSRLRGVLDHTLIQTFSFALGLPDDHLQAGLLIPVGWFLNWYNPADAIPTGHNKTALGDIGLNVKATILNQDKYPFGLAVLPFMSFPTGKGEYYLGDGDFSGGGKIIIEFKPIEKLSITFNPGILIRNRFEFASIVYDEQLLLGLGALYRIRDNFLVNAEILNKARLSAPYQHKYETPLEMLAGIRWGIGKGWMLNGGCGGGIIYGSEVPLFRTFAGISYSPPPKLIGVVEEIK